MAKVGEGDSRWIVKEREDGKNVGNWHWSETNCLRIAEDGLREKLVGLELVSTADLTCSVTELKSCEGDCYTYNRKGNAYLFFELHMKLGWKGQIKGDESTVEGTIELPNVSDDMANEPLEISVSTSATKPQSEKMRAAVREHGRDLIQGVLMSFVDDLKQRISSKQGPAPTKASQSSVNAQAAPAPSAQSAPATAPAATPKKAESITHDSIEMKLSFDCPPGAVYEALTNPHRVMGYTGAPAVIDPREGGAYELFAGAVRGKFIQLVPNEKIIMTWRMGSWEQDSTVTINFSGGARTSVVLLHENFPQRDSSGNDVRAQVQHGWQNNIFNRMRSAFGWTYTLD